MLVIKTSGLDYIAKDKYCEYQIFQVKGTASEYFL